MSEHPDGLSQILPQKAHEEELRRKESEETQRRFRLAQEQERQLQEEAEEQEALRLKREVKRRIMLEEEKRRQKAWYRQKEREAALLVMCYGSQLNAIYSDVDKSLYELTIRCIANPDFEKSFVDLCWKAGYKDVENLTDFGKALKKYYQTFLKEANEKLADNPYSWYVVYLK